jgi:hypothetical protein
MELKKGQNMIEHEAEIFSRPARTWFQTNKEKEKAEGSFEKFQCPRHEFDITLIDLSKSLHVGGEKTKVKKKTVMANDKVTNHITEGPLDFDMSYICLANSE